MKTGTRSLFAAVCALLAGLGCLQADPAPQMFGTFNGRDYIYSATNAQALVREASAQSAALATNVGASVLQSSKVYANELVRTNTLAQDARMQASLAAVNQNVRVLSNNVDILGASVASVQTQTIASVSGLVAAHNSDPSAHSFYLATRTYVDNAIAAAMVPPESAAAAYVAATNAQAVAYTAIAAASNRTDFSNMPTAVWKGTNTLSVGNGSLASAPGSAAFGIGAIASNIYAFVWNGIQSVFYGDRGPGTFNVNPVGGPSGFYIGNTSLTAVVDSAIGPYKRPSSLYNTYHYVDNQASMANPWTLRVVESARYGDVVGFPLWASNFTSTAGAPIDVVPAGDFSEIRYNEGFVEDIPGVGLKLTMAVLVGGIYSYAESVEVLPAIDYGPTNLVFTNSLFWGETTQFSFRADVQTASTTVRDFDLSLVAPAHLAATNALAVAQQALSSGGGLDTNSVRAVVGAILDTNNVYRLWGAASNATFATVNDRGFDILEIRPGLHPRIYFPAEFKAVTQPTPGIYSTNTPPQNSYEFPFDDGDWHGLWQDGANALVYYRTMDNFWVGFAPPTEFPQTLEGTFSSNPALGIATISNAVSFTTLSTNRISRIENSGDCYHTALGISTTNVLWAGIINSLASERPVWNVVTNRVYASDNTDGLTGNSNTLFYGCSWVVGDPYDTLFVSGDGSNVKTVFIDCSLENTASGDLIATPDGWDVEAYDCTFVQGGTNTLGPEFFKFCAGFHILGKTTMYQCTIIQTNSPYRTLDNSHTFAWGGEKFLDGCTAVCTTNIVHFEPATPVYVNNCTGFVGTAAGTFTRPLVTDIRTGIRYIASEAANWSTLGSVSASVEGLSATQAVQTAGIAGLVVSNAEARALLDTKVNTSSGTATNLSVVSSLTLLGKQIGWNSEKATFDIPLDNSVVLQLGQEQHIYARNQTGSALPNGKVVCSAGAVGDNASVRPASSSDASCAWGVLGMVTQDAGIPHGSDGYVTTMGEVNDLALPTDLYQASNVLWLATDGNYTNVEPVGVSVKYKLGTVLRAHATQGRILFRPEYVPTPDNIGAASPAMVTNIVNSAQSIFKRVRIGTNIVQVVATNSIYCMDVSAPNVVSNNLSELTFDGNSEARWEVWVNYTSTNALSTQWDSRMDWGYQTPMLTVTGQYKFACSTLDGSRIVARQIYPTVYQWQGIPAYQLTTYTAVGNLAAVPLYTSTTFTNQVAFSAWNNPSPLLIRIPCRAVNATSIGIYTNIANVYLTSQAEGGTIYNFGYTTSYVFNVTDKSHYPGMFYVVYPVISGNKNYKLAVRLEFYNNGASTGSGIYFDGMMERRPLNELEAAAWSANGSVPKE